MGQYLHLFDTVSAFTEAYNGEAYQEPWVSYTEETSAVTYNKSVRWDGGSVLDLRDPANNPNLERRYDYLPGWTTFEDASAIDQYYFYKLKDFVLPGMTGENPTIQTVMTDWEEAFDQTGTTGIMRYKSDTSTVENPQYDWAGADYEYGPYMAVFNYEGNPGYIWAYVYD